MAGQPILASRTLGHRPDLVVGKAVGDAVATRPVSRRPPSFVPGQQLEPGFGDVPTLSTRHQRFTRVRLTSAHLTSCPRLFRNAHYPGRCASAACGGLDPDPAIRVRGADPHLLCSKAASSWLCYIRASSSRRRGARSSAHRCVSHTGQASLSRSLVSPARNPGLAFSFLPGTTTSQVTGGQESSCLSTPLNP
jgi:hypothetical protein